MPDGEEKSIEELKTLLKRERLEKERFKLITEFATNWEFMLDPEGQIVYMSPSARDHTGYARDNFLGDQDLLFRIIHPEDRKKFEVHVEKTLGFDLLGKTLSFRFLTRTHQLKHGELSMRAVYNTHGDYLGQRASIHDVTRLVQALGKIEKIETARQYESKSREKFKQLADSRDRELTTSLLKMAQKNELLQHIQKQLQNLEPGNEEERAKLREINRRIRNDIKSRSDWEEFRMYFERNHPGFFQRLSERFPQLTSRDLKLCAYLRLQLNTKEIAKLMNITAKSAEVSRSRLRKKLGLSRDERLSIFLIRL